MTTYIGVDVCKASLDVWSEKKHVQYENNTKGIKKFIATVKPDQKIVFEPTATYHRTLHKLATANNINCCIANPFDARRLAQGLGVLAKNDKIDAKMLAKYGEIKEPRLVKYNADWRESLEELVHLKEVLNNQIHALNNQLERTQFCKDAIQIIKKTSASIEKKVLEVGKKITKLQENNPEFKHKMDILCSIKCIKETTAIKLITYCPELGTLTQGQVGALAGLAPRTRQSGSSRGRESIGGGRMKLRTALYLPSILAIRFDPILKTFYERLLKNNKPKKVAITAVMRKFLIFINAVVKKSPFYDTTQNNRLL